MQEEMMLSLHYFPAFTLQKMLFYEKLVFVCDIKFGSDFLFSTMNVRKVVFFTMRNIHLALWLVQGTFRRVFSCEVTLHVTFQIFNDPLVRTTFRLSGLAEEQMFTGLLV